LSTQYVIKNAINDNKYRPGNPLENVNVIKIVEIICASLIWRINSGPVYKSSYSLYKIWFDFLKLHVNSLSYNFIQAIHILSQIRSIWEKIIRLPTTKIIDVPIIKYHLVSNS